MIGNKGFNEWKNLPDNIKYISVFKTRFIGRVYGVGDTNVAVKQDAIVINLIYGQNEKLEVYKTKSIQDALNKANLFSQKLQLKVYDATSKQGKWVVEEKNYTIDD